MFVVETSSTGPDILCLIVPAGNDCLVVKLLCGRGDEIWGGLAFLVVKARTRDMVGDYQKAPGSKVELNDLGVFVATENGSAARFVTLHKKSSTIYT